MSKPMMVSFRVPAARVAIVRRTARKLRISVGKLACEGLMLRALNSERTRAALYSRRMNGRRISGRPPFGYRFAGKKLVKVRSEFAMFQRILSLRRAGLGYQRIAKRIGNNPRTGRPWTNGCLYAVVTGAVRAGRCLPRHARVYRPYHARAGEGR